MEELSRESRQQVEKESTSNISEGEETLLSELSKDDLFKLYKNLIGRNEFGKAEEKILEVKSHLEEILEAERAKALEKFIEEGNVTEDFSYREDTFLHEIQDIFRQYKNQKKEHFRHIRLEEEVNLRAKKEILEKLKALSEEEDGPDMFMRFRELQDEWRKSGRVPYKQAEELRETYHALSDIIYDKRSIYFELKDLDRKKNLEKKTYICEKIEQLADLEDITNLKNQFYTLRDEYRSTGPVPMEEKQSFQERFIKACDAVLEKIREKDGIYREKLENNLKTKNQILDQLREMVQLNLTDPAAWKRESDKGMELQNTWKSVGPIPRNVAETVNKEFWRLFKDFFRRKHEFFKELDKQRSGNLDIKNELCERAEALQDSTDWEKAASELKQMQQEWYKTGPVPGKYSKKLNDRFKASCNRFFDRRRNRHQVREEEQKKNREEKQTIIKEIEVLIAGENQSPEAILSLAEKWLGVGESLFAERAKELEKYLELLESFFKKFDNTDKEKTAQNLYKQLRENVLKADTVGNQYLERHERTLRKKADKLEEAISLLKNNIEFLSRSSGAEKLRKEYEQKIMRSEEELKGIRAEIKAIRRI